MKAIICYNQRDIHINSFTTEWTQCACGNVRAKWIDPHMGTVVVAARNRETVRLLGLNNSYLIPAIKHVQGDWQNLRDYHDRAIEAPGYIFDKSKASCWAVVVLVGRSSDVRWATDEEYIEAFPN